MHAIFEVHKLNEQGIEKAKDIAKSFDDLLTHLTVTVWPNDSSREMAIVRSKLEEACFYAKKALANVISYQVKE